jgi:anti-anti-sigma factor
VSTLEIAVTGAATTRTLTPIGEIDIASAGRVRSALAAAFEEGVETVVLDLEQTTFMDSTGVHIVLECQRRAQAQDVHFVVLPGPPGVQRVLELCGVRNRVTA